MTAAARDPGSEATGGDEAFDALWYLQAYPDVRAAGLDPWDHYRRTGRAEGRQGAPLRALELDHMLWRGHAGAALPELTALLRGAAGPREAGLAGWVLARWHLDQGEGAAALAAILTFHGHPAAAAALNIPGPWLLGARLCVAAGEIDRARALLRAGMRRFGMLPDFLLGEFLCRKAQGAADPELGDVLSGIWLPEGLDPVELLALPGPRFDRLGTDPGPWPRRPPPPEAPVVSVIVPVRNGGAVLKTALRGLQRQSWTALEILVVDDGSTDDSRALALAAAARDPRIRVLEAGPGGGAYVARNAGLAAATGAFVTVHDADDWSHPQKIERQVAPLLAEPEVRATVSHWVRADDDLNMTRWRDEDRWVHRNVSSLMIRAGLRDSLGYWDRVRVNADTEYYCRLIAAHGAGAIREVLPGVPLAFGRTGPDSLTGRRDTHLRTQFHGLRRDYMAAAQAWHDRAAGTEGGLHLAQFPACRPFRIPAGIGLGDPDPDPAPFDLLTGSDLFDPAWYGLCYPDVLRADLDPVRHYLAAGARENRDPGPGFSTGGYRRAMGLGPGDNPLLHYETRGRAAGAAPLPRLPGALAGSGLPRRLVFAHTSGRTLFGAERSLLDVLGRMAQAGFAPVVVVPMVQNPEYLDRLLAVSAAVECVPQLWWRVGRAPHPATVARIRALIRDHDAAEVHVNTMVLDAPLDAARAEGAAGVVHLRELPEGDVALCRALGADAATLRRLLLERADRFIVTTRLAADWLGCPERTEIRPNSVDPELFGLPFAPGPSLRVAIVSSNIAKKGLADFLALARIVAADRPEIRFLIFGPETRDLHLMQPFPPNVAFRGYAETPAAAMAQADVVVSLSKFAESFGRTVMEAMAAGRPVVCYDRGAPPTLVESGRSGFVVPADDVGTAALAILALDVARDRLALFSAAARARAMALQDSALRPA